MMTRNSNGNTLNRGVKYGGR